MKASTVGFVAVSLAGLAACEGVDPSSTEPVESVQSALSTCSWGDGNYTRVGDVNSDGRTDLMSATGNVVNLYKGQPGVPGGIAFQQTGTLGVWGAGNYTWAADINGDGHTDYVSGIGGSLYVKLWDPVNLARFNNTTYSIPNFWGQAGYTFAGHFTWDNPADIATASGSTITLFNYSNGAPNITTTTSSVASNWGGPGCGPQCATPSGFTWVADFDNDGLDDIASGGGTNVLMQHATGTGFTSQNFTVAGNWGQSGYTFVGNFVPNRRVIASASGGNVYMKWLDPTTHQFISQTWSVSNTWGSSDYTWVGDFDGNGLTDIASASGASIYVKLSTGSGFVSQTWTGPASWGTTQFTRAGDFNGDGRADILTAIGCNLTLMSSTGANFNPTPL